MAHVYSMTGFAIEQGQSPLGLVTVELRSVNSRFLDVTLKIAEDLRSVEPAVRARINARLSRGKFECRIGLKSSSLEGSGINQKGLESLLELQEKLLAIAPSTSPMTAAEILAYPGIVESATIDPAQLETSVLATLDRALDAYDAAREREGASLAQKLVSYCDSIDTIAGAVHKRLPDILAVQKAKLTQRLQEALGETLTRASTITGEEVSERIRQELTLYALKMDVDEEITRLFTHTREVRRVLCAGGSVGRRLDFLMQEMNRESNTLGSKAVAIEMTDASVNLKLAIEQMREQIQNLQ